ncbi:unnamed protein product [Caenorhabditis auriculariae]|uniref:LIM zinc-binding domain-containing protein n=1 Tax=Caenorhabditis auriculariae TaxID=2777116 RepID=A0A8S1HUS7_9PELO|nr:unnamed protein product [Caenorhabditis auriculariae]
MCRKFKKAHNEERSSRSSRSVCCAEGGGVSSAGLNLKDVCVAPSSAHSGSGGDGGSGGGGRPPEPVESRENLPHPRDLSLSSRSMTEEEDPYALSSSESEDEGPKKPIKIEGRSGDISQLKSALFENKEKLKDEAREEELAALKQTKELKKMKKEFEEGKVHNTENDEDDALKIARLEERQRLTEIGKEKYSQFKTKFENLDTTLGENLEERMKRLEKETIGLGKESLASAKQSRDPTADEAPKDCAVCSKTVYPVERVFANKRLYHINCFKCIKCSKKLTPTNYNSHEGKLLCKVHMLEVFHPELAKTMDPGNTEEDEHAPGGDDDDDEFAVSSKPKTLAGVVKSGASAVHDELAQLKSLKEKKGDFESSIKDAELVEKRTKIDQDLLQAGKVKANAERFVSGAALEDKSDDDSESVDRDPNVIRSSRKPRKEDLHFEQVGGIKDKWKKGDVETATSHEAAERKEIEALKGGPSVKDRFKERNEGDEVVERQWNRNELDTSAAAEARKSFLEGHAYESGANVEKTARDLDDLQFSHLKGFKEKFEKGEEESTNVAKTAVEVGEVQLGNIKATFEKGEGEEMSAEERAALKKREIEAEFQRYKLARRAAAERNAEEEDVKVEAGGNADVGSIKDRFDRGDAFKAQTADEKQIDVELKMAGKAREKFRQIDASGAAPVAPGLKKTEPSKWDKKDDKPVAEVINKRVQQDDVEEEGEDAFDVKNLMNKFKSIGETTAVKTSSEHRAELEALKSEAKNFKAKFENAGEDDDATVAEERRRQREEEFEALKREREEAQRKLEEERLAEAEASQRVEQRDEDVAIKADHASKMTAKWEKIQAKEAKKAEKGRMPEKKSGAKFSLPPPEKCSICAKSVYRAEQFQCFGDLYHINCFRCVECRQALRVERVHRSKEGQLYCRVHFKLLEERRGSLIEENNNVEEKV